MINFIVIKIIILSCMLVITSFIDIKHQIIPNKLVFIILILGLIFSFIGDISLFQALLGMMVGGGIMLILALVPNVLGGGDIKLVFALGAFLGPIKIIWAIFFAFIFAAVLSIILLIFKIKKKNEFIPFGPFLAVGTIVAYIFI